MKKVLILGAGNAQIDAIEYCKGQGYKVYGCSYTDTDKGIPYLDEFKQINIIDAEAVAEYVKDNGIDLVYSVGSDLAMPTVAKVSEKLGLPHFVSYDTALTCNLKHKMRVALGNDFKGNVPFKVIEKLEEAEDFECYPAMMKPVDSQGQRGVHKVESFEEIKENFEKSMLYSKSGKIILESYLEGQEISVNTYVKNGKVIFALVSDRVSFKEFPGGIIKKHLLPTQFSKNVVEKVKDLVQRVLQKLEIKDGPAYFQIKVVGDEPYLIEVTPRLDGCHMWRLINIYCGVNLLDMSFKQLIGESVSCEPKYKEGNYTLKFMCQPPYTEVISHAVEPGIYTRWYYDIGDKVKELNGYMEKCGYNIFKE